MAVLDWLQQLLGGGDPEAAGAAQAGTAMQPMTQPWLDKVLSGEMARSGIQDVNDAFASGDPVALAGSFGPSPLGIRAFHGSPHSFDQFDLGKIGTGEGAQAYGHGLYFAESEPVAQSYRDALASPTFKTPDGTLFDPQTQLQHLNVRATAHNNGPDLEATIARAKDLLTRASDQTAPMLNHDIRVLQSFKDAGGISQNPGHMYEVDINAKPEDFLPWDQPASQWPDAPLGAAQDIAAARGMKLGDVTGERFYKELTSNMQPYFGQLTDADARRASEALLAQGIPGIRYLDQGSRQPRYQVTSNRPDFPAPTFQTMADAQMRADYMRRRGYEPEIKELPGSSNYAIWTPEIVTILRRYGLLPPVAAAGGLLAGPGQGEAAQP